MIVTQIPPVTSSCHYPRVLEKEPSSLTCTYSVDVNATRTDFMVVRDGGADEKGIRIVSCVWVSDDLNCTTAPGYELNSAVTDVVVITTQQASRDQAGSYACHVIGSEAEGFESCEFIVVTESYCEQVDTPTRSEQKLQDLYELVFDCSSEGEYEEADCESDTSESEEDSATLDIWNLWSELQSSVTFLKMSVRQGGSPLSPSTRGRHIEASRAAAECHEKDILDCYWLSGKRECHIMLPGYSFNGTISHSLTLEIPRVSTEHMGKYACKLSSMDPDNIKPCELKFDLVGKTKCDVRSVDQTSQTSLTCYFPENLNETRAGLSVYHHTSLGDKESVMSCRWKDDSFNCTIANGYEFDGSVTDHVTLTLSSASQRQRGKYSCHMTDQPSVSSQLCLFPLENDTAVNSSCSIPSVQEMESTTLTCRYSVDMNVTRRNFTVVHLDDVDILNCIWLNDQLDCTPAPGYQFNITVTDHLVIGVPRASRNHNGTYACHVMGSDEENFAPCEFIITQGVYRGRPARMNSHILRIAAASPSKRFFRYVLPRIPIEPMAESIHNISFVEGRLCKNGKPVDALAIRQALSEFLEFLGDKPVTLFSHNCRKFSAPILFTAVTACDMLAELDGKITGFVDTLYLFRNVYPGLHYGQRDLYEHFFNESYEANEEMNDVTSLERLLDLPRVTLFSSLYL
ncbi:hypothetical protein C0Q70_18398 [Pomacea canaliculata]|uniref:Ig-like domain-containing protein n=1 Tax=Pomacea canaliculata TaxID=400727 RepID=A0A2T7NN31_POMCA|nr:hypothetical protein C0Q70_18398 [Pomacea canaliculata]